MVAKASGNLSQGTQGSKLSPNSADALFQRKRNLHAFEALEHYVATHGAQFDSAFREIEAEHE